MDVVCIRCALRPCHRMTLVRLNELLETSVTEAMVALGASEGFE